MGRCPGSVPHRRSRNLSGSPCSHGDVDFPSGVALLHVPDGLGGLAQRVGPVDGRGDLPGFDELLEDEHVLVVLLGDQRRQLLVHEPGQQERPELAIEASEPGWLPGHLDTLMSRPRAVAVVTGSSERVTRHDHA
jgi:hypothetical protein